MREMQNALAHRPAYTLQSLAACPIPAGQVGLWFNGTNVYIRHADGSDSAQAPFVEVSRTITAGMLAAGTPIEIALPFTPTDFLSNKDDAVTAGALKLVVAMNDGATPPENYFRANDKFRAVAWK